MSAFFSAAGAVPAHADWQTHGKAELSRGAHEVRVGASLPLTPWFNGSIVQHFWLSQESYSVAAGRLQVPAAEYALGYGRRDRREWWHAALGLQYRELRGKGAKTPAAEEAPDLQLGLHLDGQMQLGAAWAIGGSFEAYPASKGVKVRGRLLRRIGDDLALGPEVTVEHRAEENSRQVGFVLQGVEPVRGLQTALRAGMYRDDDGDAGPFIGIEFQHRF
jgi:hypothetical protein